MYCLQSIIKFKIKQKYSFLIKKINLIQCTEYYKVIHVKKYLMFLHGILLWITHVIFISKKVETLRLCSTSSNCSNIKINFAGHISNIEWGRLVYYCDFSHYRELVVKGIFIIIKVDHWSKSNLYGNIINLYSNIQL